jgi:hypothetical protein
VKRVEIERIDVLAVTASSGIVFGADGFGVMLRRSQGRPRYAGRPTISLEDSKGQMIAIGEQDR